MMDLSFLFIQGQYQQKSYSKFRVWFRSIRAPHIQKFHTMFVTLFLWPWDQKIGYMLLAMPLFSSFSRHSLASPPWKSPPWLFLALIFRDCAAPLPPARCYLTFSSTNKIWFYSHTRRCPIATVLHTQSRNYSTYVNETILLVQKL